MYDLHSLGWHAFQQLCLSILGEILGQTVQRFLDTNDGGRDGAFAGEWHPSGKESLKGRYVVQCKFTNRRGHSLRVSDLIEEAEKAARLARDGICDVYVLMTNGGISGRTEQAFDRKLREAGVSQVIVLGSSWIEEQIKTNKRLRMLAPRVYGLGDLSQIIDERAYNQARAILESLREDLAKVVVTGAYQKAAKALDEHGFVLLIGEPAAGKTTLASMLAMAAADQWGASVMKLDAPSSVVEHWNPDEPSQFFWIDDAFGVTQYEAELVLRWNHVIPHIRTMLRKGSKIIMTSRDYIYNRARQELKESAFPLFRESQVVIDVHALTLDERRQMLYNHLKLGKQSVDFRKKIKPFLESVASHPRFIPETARRLAEPFFTRNLYLGEWHLEQFVAKREEFLLDTLNGLDRHSNAALALIYMRSGELGSPIELTESEATALVRLGSDLGACRVALEALNGSLVSYSHTPNAFWRYKHPTIGDAFSRILARSPELLSIFIQGSDVDKLIEQVTCGDVGIQNAVVVPNSLFRLVMSRIEEYASGKYKNKWLATWGAKWDLDRFLTRRCDREFLEAYVATHPELLARVAKPGLYLDAVTEVSLAARLHQVGLLPEEHRRSFVTQVTEYAVDGDDVAALDDDEIRSLFTAEELTVLEEGVRTKLLPRLKDVRYQVEVNFSTGSAEEHMDHFVQSMETLKEHFKGDHGVVLKIKEQIASAAQWVAEHSDEEEERPERKLGSVESQVALTTRSIFDDVDS